MLKLYIFFHVQSRAFRVVHVVSHVDPILIAILFVFLCCFLYSRSARGARAELHAPKAPKSKAELAEEAAAEELMAKHREVGV